MVEEKKETMVKHEVVKSPEVVELEAKIAKYEKEINAHKLVGNLAMAEAIKREVDGLRFRLNQIS